MLPPILRRSLLSSRCSCWPQPPQPLSTCSARATTDGGAAGGFFFGHVLLFLLGLDSERNRLNGNQRIFRLFSPFGRPLSTEARPTAERTPVDDEDELLRAGLAILQPWKGVPFRPNYFLRLLLRARLPVLTRLLAAWEIGEERSDGAPLAGVGHR